MMWNFQHVIEKQQFQQLLPQAPPGNTAVMLMLVISESAEEGWMQYLVWAVCKKGDAEVSNWASLSGSQASLYLI